MILPMKKVSLVVMNKHKDAALDILRNIGVLHIESKNVVSDSLSKLFARKADVERALEILNLHDHEAKAVAKIAAKEKAKDKKKGIVQNSPTHKRASDFINPDGVPFAVEALNAPDRKRDDLALHVLDLEERFKFLTERTSALVYEKTKDKCWGEFNPEDLPLLEKNGIPLYLYEIAHKDMETLPVDIPYFITGKDDRVVCIAALKEIPDETPFAVSENSISEINKILVDIDGQLKDTKKQLVSLVLRKHVIKQEQANILQQIEYETAKADMEILNEAPADYTVSWITGFVPVEDMNNLTQTAKENSWAVISDDPGQEDNPPTKLKNNSFTKLIYPVTGFLELIPGYREKDISFWFLIFFTLFFAMIFGDAAYGMVLLVISIVGIIKTMKKGVPLFLKFLLLMSIANVTWGSLVCSWFAMDTALVPGFL